MGFLKLVQCYLIIFALIPFFLGPLIADILLQTYYHRAPEFCQRSSQQQAIFSTID